MKLFRMTDADDELWGLWDETAEQWVEQSLTSDEASAIVLSWGFPRSLDLPQDETSEIVRPAYVEPEPIQYRYRVDVVITCENGEGESVEWGEPETLCGPTTEEGAEAFVAALVMKHGEELTPSGAEPDTSRALLLEAFTALESIQGATGQTLAELLDGSHRYPADEHLERLANLLETIDRHIEGNATA